MAHSPGPWKVVEEHYTRMIETADLRNIMGDEAYYPWTPKEDDDWYLIAAAPELLAALELIESALREDSRDKSIIGDEVEYHLDGQTMGYAIQTAREAISKAKRSE